MDSAMMLLIVSLTVGIMCQTTFSKSIPKSLKFTRIQMSGENPRNKLYRAGYDSYDSYTYPTYSVYKSNKIRTRSKSRTNSRYLHSFPATEILEYARHAAMSGPRFGGYPYQPPYHMNTIETPPYGGFRHRTSPDRSDYRMKARISDGNSPIYYIKLPPSPYVFMPGVGYVSPHPYNGQSSPPGAPFGLEPMMMSMGGGSKNKYLPAMDRPENNVISLPLKFLSNGRPHQIGTSNAIKKGYSSASKENSQMISGGRFSFNGKPTAVFVVRSPAHKNMI